MTRERGAVLPVPDLHVAEEAGESLPRITSEASAKGLRGLVWAMSALIAMLVAGGVLLSMWGTRKPRPEYVPVVATPGTLPVGQDMPDGGMTGGAGNVTAGKGNGVLVDGGTARQDMTADGAPSPLAAAGDAGSMELRRGDGGAPRVAAAEAGRLQGADGGLPLSAGRKARKRLPIVVDYDGQAAPDPPRPSVSSTEGYDLEAAREAYRQASAKYWYGDFAGAEALYKKALSAYPGYAAGYRGLGLVYARRGDNAQAVQAFTKYLTMAPNARDVAEIRKRISLLQGGDGSQK